MGKFCQIYQELKFKKQNLAGLFDVKIEVKPMPIQVDIKKTFLYKWGKEEGLKEGLKKAILLDIKSKFGSSKAKQIKIILDKINDITRLEKIKREIIKAKTWEDFVISIKNSNSKNKI